MPHFLFSDHYFGGKPPEGTAPIGVTNGPGLETEKTSDNLNAPAKKDPQTSAVRAKSRSKGQFLDTDSACFVSNCHMILPSCCCTKKPMKTKKLIRLADLSTFFSNLNNYFWGIFSTNLYDCKFTI